MRCLQCDSEMHKGPVELEGEYRGRKVRVSMRGLKCPSCGYSTIRGRDMTEFSRLVKEEYRSHEQMLRPEDLKQAREELGMPQEVFAQFVDVGVASVKRIESGAVQERLTDEHIRMRLYPELIDAVLIDRIWKIHEAKGSLAQLPSVAAQWSEEWSGLVNCFQSVAPIYANFDLLVAETFATCSERFKDQSDAVVKNSRSRRKPRVAITTPPSCELVA
jgi:putative zinc finger/helix-turn-helix YgiT family protein